MRLFNVSTGMAVKNGSGKAAGGVLCLAFEPTGAELWAGDSKVGPGIRVHVVSIIIWIMYMCYHYRDQYSLTL